MKDQATETYDFLASVIGNAPYGIITIDSDGLISICNQLALSQLGIEQRTKKVLKTLITDHLQKAPRLRKKIIQSLAKGRKPFNLNNIIVKDRNLSVKGRPIGDGMIITTADMTEAKAMERNMLKSMLEGQDNERRRLAKEIHDGIGPLMSTIKLNMDSIKKDMTDAPEKTLKKMDMIEELVRNIATDIRAISHALMPSALRDFGLIATLENLVMKANSAEMVTVELFDSNMERRLEESIALGLYRITQELLNNALKNAQAKNITIQLVKHPKHITLTVEDDGLGFDKEKLAERRDGGIGLRNIKARATAMNGTFNIDSSPGNGVTATLVVPVN